jgi:hypothetical protein
MRAKTIGLAAIIAVIASTAAAQQQCDPDKILRSNVEQYNESVAVFLAQQRDYTDNINAGHNASAGFTYDGFPLNANDAGTFARLVHESTGYTLSGSESISLLRSTLSDSSVFAYINCLKFSNPDPIAILLNPSVITETTFQFRVGWHPNYRTPARSRLVLNLTNGKINGKNRVAVDMQPTDVLPFEVKRDENGARPLMISASINGQTSDITTVPALPNFKVTLKPKLSQPISICRSGGCGTNYVADAVTTEPDEGSGLLPGTLKFILATLRGDVDRMYSCPDFRASQFPHRCDDYSAANNDSFHVTGEVRGSAGANEADNFISGRFSVLETVITSTSGQPAAASLARAPTVFNSVSELMNRGVVTNWDIVSLHR